MSDLDAKIVHDVEMTGQKDSLFDALLSLLKKEIETYEELYRTFIKESDILVRSSLDELYDNNAKKETCILKAKMLDEARNSLVGKLAKLLELNVKEVNLSMLMPFGSETQAHELGRCKNDLHGLLYRIKNVNEKNVLLLDSSLSYVQKSIRFIGQFMAPGATYLDTGKLHEYNMSGRILARKG